MIMYILCIIIMQIIYVTILFNGYNDIIMYYIHLTKYNCLYIYTYT